MKKNLALILALVMLLSTVFAVVPMAAEAEATPPAAASKYEPKISYANINYSDKMYMMFAVPAPATLNEGNTVNLLVWNGIASEAYSIKDQNAELLSAEADKVTIGEAQYLVYKYGGLTAADMTKIISARPVIVNTWEETVKVEISPEEKNDAGEVIKEAVYEDQIVVHKDAVEYGDLVEYSVLEYVATAKGQFGGAALADDVVAMLDSMLVFGSLAQKYSGSEYEYLADDELSKIWYVPVINGVVGEKVFGGFFKKGVELATVSAPYVAGYAFTSFIDAEGNALYDIDGLATNGDQMLVAGEGALPLDENGDLVIKANYDLLYFYRPDANKATDASTNMYEEGTGNKWTSDKGGLGINLGKGEDSGDFNYGALDVIDDPYQAGNKVYRIVGNMKHNMGPGNTTNDWKVSLKPSATPGFNDTLAPVITVDIIVARGANGEMLRTGNLNLRSGSNGETSIGYFRNDGTFALYNGEGTVTLDAKVAATGYSRFVFVVDFAQEAIFAFAAENAADELVYQAVTCAPKFSGKGEHKAGNSWIKWGNTLDRLEWWGQAGNNFTDEEKNGGLLADLDGDGVVETPMMVDGVSNKAAIKWCFENYKPTMLVKEYCAYAGSPVDVPTHEHAFVRGECSCGAKDPNYVPEIDATTAQAMYRQYRALLIKDWDSYIGYAGQPVETIYNIDANAANVPSKNSQLMINNFTDDKLASYYKGEGYDGLDLTLGGLGMNAAKIDTTNPLQYAGIDVIDDPYYTGEGTNKVYSFNGGVIKDGETLGAYIWHGKLTKNAPEAYVGSLAATKLESWATTPVITYDMTVGGNGYDRMLETDTIRFRGASDTFVHLFKIAADGSILICQPNAEYTDAEFVDTGVDVKKNGWTRIVAEVDCANKTFKLYAADEGAELVLLGTVSGNLWITKSGISHGAATANTLYKDAENWQALAAKLDRTEFVAAEGDANKFTEAEKMTADSFKPAI